ncbi:MAG: tetratricopeptide repeat protein [Flavobacteriales bacterium]|nr:tetratricopeptide repeat protein [Flavobacteriales bacterium]MCC6938426.1 tetratricopeptide repeat protein [Flavobacteriales bacterium]
MMGLKKPQLFVLAGAVVVIVLLVLAPRTPSGKKEEAAAVTPSKARIMEAVALVQGQDPMRGIMMLREIVKEEPDNAEAHWQLGLFAVQSGQMDKALERFRKVRELDAAGFPDVWFYLGRTYESMDSTDQAIACLLEYRKMVQDTAITKEVDRILKELKDKQ